MADLDKVPVPVCVGCGRIVVSHDQPCASVELAYCTDKLTIPAYQETASDTPIIDRSRTSCEGMTQPEIMAAMITEAKAAGYEPSDRNRAGLPNIYLRERIRQEVLPGGELSPPEHVEDLFVMNVRPKTDAPGYRYVRRVYFDGRLGALRVFED